MINKYIFDYRLVLEEDPSFRKFVDIGTERTPIRHHNVTAIINRSSMSNSEAENDIINFVHDEEGRFDDTYEDTDSLWEKTWKERDSKKVRLRQEYMNVPSPDYDSSVSQLLPPKRFLLPGSQLWQGEYTFYDFINSSMVDDSSPVCEMNRYGFSQEGCFARLQRTTYRFDRKRNFTSELKKHFVMWTYNSKTKQLYEIRKIKKNALKKRSRYRNSVKKVFNTLSNSAWHTVPARIFTKFVNTILEAAKEDVPDIIAELTPSTMLNTEKIIIKSGHVKSVRNHGYQLMNLAFIILQHRIGQPIRWLNYVLIKNIWSILGDPRFQERVILGTYAYYPGEQRKDAVLKARALRRGTIYQLVPNLRESNHMKTAIKTILGKGYSKFLIKLLNTDLTNSTFFLAGWLFAVNEGLISRNLYHWVAQTIANGSPGVAINMMDNIGGILNSILRDYWLKGHNDTSEWNRFSIILDSYIRVCKRMSAADVNPPNWHTWRDMFNMAGQLGVRIRPNKLNSANEIRSLHDKLSNIINRDKITIKKYKNSVFEEFISPDKEYDGFEFIQMRTAQDLVDEGKAMHHCVGSYADRCASGKSIIFSMRKNERSYVTIELDPRTYGISQQYTLHDITVTNRKVLDIINEWNNDCIELHKGDKESYYEVCQKKVRAFLDKERAKSLKELIKDGITDSESQVLQNERPYGGRMPYVSAIQ